MKRYTTKFLKSVALIYLAFPVTYLIASAILFDIPVSNFGQVVFSAFYCLLSFLCVIVGYGLWEVRRWAWYLLIGVNILIAYENAIVLHHYGETHNQVLSFIASLLILAGIMHSVSKEVRVPYFFPKIRWWESNPRYRLCVPVSLSRPSVGSNGELLPPIDAEILDLSMGGCFVKLRSELKQDEFLALSFRVFGFLIECSGTVVWRTQSTVTHPKGVGVKFSLLSRPQKRVLRKITTRLRKIASFYRRSRYLMSQEEFVKKLEELENSKGARDTA